MHNTSPAGSQAGPVSKARLVELAEQAGVTKDATRTALSRGRREQRVGKAFEQFVIRSARTSANQARFNSSARSQATRGRSKQVSPDVVWDVDRYTANVFGPPTVSRLKNGQFVEVKAVHGTINLSYDDYQVLGLLDALDATTKNSRERQETGIKPVLVFVTTADTKIGADVIAEATKRGIRLRQAIVEEVPPDGKGNYLRIGPTKELNGVNLSPSLPPGKL